MKNNSSRPGDGNPIPDPQAEHYKMLEKENKLVLSYKTVRSIIGFLGLFLPFMLIIGSILFGGCDEIQLSISNYYHTNMRDVFVGYVCALSIFLIGYKGYDWLDHLIATLAGVFGLIVALFPTSLKVSPIDGTILDCNIQCNVDIKSWVGVLHLIAAGLFILSLAYFALILFTKGEYTPTPQKLLRNKIYRIAGWIMLSCVGLMVIFFLLPDSVAETLVKFKPVFWFETIAFVAFGFAWLVKGGLFFKDK